MAGLWRVWLALGALAIIIGLALFAEGGGGRLGSPTPALADGAGSPPDCNTDTKAEWNGSDWESEPEGELGFQTTDNEEYVTITAPEGEIIVAICIKSGEGAFGEGDWGEGDHRDQHSRVITEDGQYGVGDCFDVSGLGTDQVIVRRSGSESCSQFKGLSHIDVLLASPGSITVVKFQDADNDGERDGEEQLLSGWTINLYRGDNCDDEENFLTSAVTDGDGQVVFADLLPGQYSVSEEQRTGWQQTAPRNESGVLECFNFTLSSGQSLEVRFGNAEVVTGGGGNGGSGGTGGDGGNGGDGGDGGTGGTGGGGQQDGQQGGQQQEGQQDSQQQQQQGGQQQVQQVGAVQLPRGGAGQALTSGRFPASLQAVAGLALVAAGLALLVGTPILARRRGR